MSAADPDPSAAGSAAAAPAAAGRAAAVSPANEPPGDIRVPRSVQSKPTNAEGIFTAKCDVTHFVILATAIISLLLLDGL